MAASPDSSSRGDVRKLTHLFKTLGGCSSDSRTSSNSESGYRREHGAADIKKPFGFISESSGQKGYTAAYGTFLAANRGPSKKQRPSHEPFYDTPLQVPYSDFKVKPNKTVSELREILVGEYWNEIPLPVPYNEGFKVKPDKTVTFKLREKVTGEYRDEGPCVPCDEGSKVNSKPEVDYTPVGYSSRSGELVEPDYPQGPWVCCYEGFSIVNSEETVTSTPVGYSSKRSEAPSVPCKKSSKEHPPYSYCPYKPCDVCYNVHHPTNCPYFHHLPQGAAFDRDNYEIVCGCGNLFNEEKWACTLCGGDMPVLQDKQCIICFNLKMHSTYDCSKGFKRHSTYDCPKAEVLAAKYRSFRDHMLSVGFDMIPCDEVPDPEAVSCV